MPLG